MASWRLGVAFLLLSLCCGRVADAQPKLPSWNDGAVKGAGAIVDFVARVTSAVFTSPPVPT
jgi:hypothetical protein